LAFDASVGTCGGIIFYKRKNRRLIGILLSFQDVEILLLAREHDKVASALGSFS